MISTEELYDMAQKNGVICFWRKGEKYGCFSQWSHSPFEKDGNKFYTAEQYMMWGKAKLFGDESVAKRILKAKSPREQKKLGREVRGFKPSVWNKEKCKIVEEGNMLKFMSNEKLKETLLGTGSKVLVEASPEDKIWGIGLRESDPASKDPFKWKGKNLLGICLMVVRHRINESSK